jgi:hypothetical protein
MLRNAFQNTAGQSPSEDRAASGWRKPKQPRDSRSDSRIGKVEVPFRKSTRHLVAVGGPAAGRYCPVLDQGEDELAGRGHRPVSQPVCFKRPLRGNASDEPRFRFALSWKSRSLGQGVPVFLHIPFFRKKCRSVSYTKRCKTLRRRNGTRRAPVWPVILMCKETNQ